jgi:hypothetical protein
MHQYEMQQIIIYLNKQFSTVLFPCENQAVTYDKCQKLFSSRHDIEHTIESIVVAQPKHKTDRLPTSQPYQPRLL